MATTSTDQTAAPQPPHHAGHQPLHHHDRPHPLARLRTSQSGLDFIFRHEAQAGVTNHLYWPGGASGVTLGAGYDMKQRSAPQILHDLVAIGLTGGVAQKVSAAHGLIGSVAEDFADDNYDLVNLSHQQELSLLALIVPHYENIVKRNVFVAQSQNEFDALVSFCYNPGGSFLPVSDAINRSKIDDAMAVIRQRIYSGGHQMDGLVQRRSDEVNLYLHATYTVTAPSAPKSPNATKPGGRRPLAP